MLRRSINVTLNRPGRGPNLQLATRVWESFVKQDLRVGTDCPGCGCGGDPALQFDGVCLPAVGWSAVGHVSTLKGDSPTTSRIGLPWRLPTAYAIHRLLYGLQNWLIFPKPMECKKSGGAPTNQFSARRVHSRLDDKHAKTGLLVISNVY